jgi:hypothetical protein
MAVLARDKQGAWRDMTHTTGELAYHGNQSSPAFSGVANVDVNLDGRQGVAAFYADRSPMVFFSRGFRCFGLAWSLDPTKAGDVQNAGTGEVPEGFLALTTGQQAGLLDDVNGDGLPDLVAVDTHNKVWAVFSKCGRETILQLRLLPGSGLYGPLAVKTNDGSRDRGVHQVRPGFSAVYGTRRRGTVTLSWTTPDGKAATHKVVLLKSQAVRVPPDAAR